MLEHFYFHLYEQLAKIALSNLVSDRIKSFIEIHGIINNDD